VPFVNAAKNPLTPIRALEGVCAGNYLFPLSLSTSLGSAIPIKLLNASNIVSHLFRKRQSLPCARFDPARLSIAASASRSCSTPLRYTCTCDNELWPLTAMISGPVHPACAS
jgi:hypothetical protein